MGNFFVGQHPWCLTWDFQCGEPRENLWEENEWISWGVELLVHIKAESDCTTGGCGVLLMGWDSLGSTGSWWEGSDHWAGVGSLGAGRPRCLVSCLLPGSLVRASVCQAGIWSRMDICLSPCMKEL